MTDTNMPELTLTPDTAAAAEMPTLTLTPEAPATPAAPEVKKEVEPVVLDDSMLTEQEKAAVNEFAKKIDVRDTNQVLQYGAAAQKSVASFSENALSNVRNKDMGEIGEDLSRPCGGAEGLRRRRRRKRALAGLFKKTSNKLETMKAQYSKVETNVDKIARESGEPSGRPAEGRGHVRPDV